MRIEHLAIWTLDLETMKAFYEKYFMCRAGAKYVNAKKEFQSYFLTFDSGCRLELMQKPGIVTAKDNVHQEFTGITHVAISVGSKEQVDVLTAQLRKDGFQIAGEPRTTGDGYYESVVLDPEGNRIEITV